MGAAEYRAVQLLAGHRFAVVAVADNGREPPEPVEIAVVHVNGGAVAGPAETWLVRPRRPIASCATRGHGITDEAVETAPDVSVVADAVRDAIDGRILVAHRGEAVAALLRAVLPGWTPPHAVLDVRRLAGRVWPTASRALGALTQVARLDVAGSLGRAGHDALATALLLLTATRIVDTAARRCRQPLTAEHILDWATPPRGGPAW